MSSSLSTDRILFFRSYQFICDVDPNKIETFNSIRNGNALIVLIEWKASTICMQLCLFHRMLSFRDDKCIHAKLNEKKMRTFEWWKFDCDRTRNSSSLHFSNGILMFELTCCHVLLRCIEIDWMADMLRRATICQCTLRFLHVCRISHRHHVKNVNARIFAIFSKNDGNHQVATFLVLALNFSFNSR